MFSDSNAKKEITLILYKTLNNFKSFYNKQLLPYFTSVMCVCMCVCIYVSYMCLCMSVQLYAISCKIDVHKFRNVILNSSFDIRTFFTASFVSLNYLIGNDHKCEKKNIARPYVRATILSCFVH